MAEIVLLPVDAPVAEEVQETPSAAPETSDDAIPAKRGRGRPPGARNKPKTTTVEPVETKIKRRPPTPPQEESEDDGPPTPPPVKRRPKKRPPPPQEESDDDEPPTPPVKRKPKKRPPPPSESEEEAREPNPREKHRQAHADVLTRRRDHHRERVQNYSTLLDHMLAY